MINQSNNIGIKVTAFDAFNQGKRDSNYWIMQSEKQSDINLSEILSPKKARRTKNIKTIGISAASITLLTAAGIFVGFKGGPKTIAKNFRALHNSLERKLQKSKLTIQEKPLHTKILTLSLKTTDKFLNRAEVINNFTTIKDLLFKKFMNFTKFTNKIHNKITELFSKIARNAVRTSYEETFDKFKETMGLSRIFESKIYGGKLEKIIDINGIKKTKIQWLNELGIRNSDLLLSYKNGFGKNAQLLRLKSYKKSLENLENIFEKKGVLWFMSKDTLNRFVAEGAIASDKNKLQKQIKNCRELLSFSSADILKEIDSKIIELTKILSYKDTENITSLKKVYKNIEKFLKSDKKNVNKELLEEISRLKANILSSELVNKKENIDSVVNELDEIMNLLKNTKKGKVENILEIYKALLSKEDYKKIERAYKGNIVALDKSIKLESQDYLNKLRDLTLGSAPTDILTILTGFGTLGYYLLKADDNKQRTSISLKYGIPALVGIGTVLYGNAKLFAGSKSLLFGTISMWITNRFGDTLNSILENHWQKKDKKVKTA